MRKTKQALFDSKFNEALEVLPEQQQGQIKHARKAGQFLSVMSSISHGTILSAVEFRDGIQY